MAVKANVFASRSERDNFYKLSRVWSDNYRLYHNLPFLSVFDVGNVFDWEAAEPLTLSEADVSRLKKTSIDYTLCDFQDKPLVCVEFDGLQAGANVGIEYFSNHRNPDVWRQMIMDRGSLQFPSERSI